MTWETPKSSPLLGICWGNKSSKLRNDTSFGIAVGGETRDAAVFVGG